jgi:hypothetical protein
MSEDVGTLIRDHAVRGTRRRWESAGVAPWDRCVVAAGELDDGRWYVERQHHPTVGPAKAQVYDTEGDALHVARAVMAAAAQVLNRPFVFVETGQD